MAHILQRFYQTLYDHYGPQHWWPGESPFEVMVGTVLTQNTNWTNVKKALDNLKAARLLEPEKLHNLSHSELAILIRPAGYFNLKAKRLKNLLAWFCNDAQASFAYLKQFSTPRLREELLSVKGIGPETADSIILYALEKPTFVVDTYTCRVLVRHQLIDTEADYDQIKDYCERNLPEDTRLYNEYHALFVRVGKEQCKPRPRCANCPLNQYEHSCEI